MDLQDNLARQFGSQVSLEETEHGVYRVYAPFFHEDGDMYSVYFEVTGNQVLIRDYGNTLMRVSYTYDIHTTHQKKVLSEIVSANRGELDGGELLVRTTAEQISQALMQYTQLVAKVSNIDILRRENVRSLFYEHLDGFIDSEMNGYTIKKNITPSKDRDLVVDYVIPDKRPLYIFGVLENTKAAKVVITCLTFQTQQMPFRSLVIHENADNLSSFNRNRLTNTVGKQYTTLEEFMNQGTRYIRDEFSA